MFYNKLKNSLYTIGEDTIEKHSRVQASYHSKCRRRINAHYAPRPSSRSSSSTPTRHARTAYRSRNLHPESQYPESQIDLEVQLHANCARNNSTQLVEEPSSVHENYSSGGDSISTGYIAPTP